MEKGISNDTNYLFRCLSNDKKEEIGCYLSEISNRDFFCFSNSEDINQFNEHVNSFLNNLKESEISDLKTYTGYQFREINAVLRNKWNYEENGMLTDDKKNYYGALGRNVANIIQKFPTLEANFKTFRGVSIKAFWDYGIHSIEELVNLEGNYLYEKGFTSTSVLRENSFYEKKTDWGEQANIEIEYMIPEESKDGALLINDEVSYSANQGEYLINSGSLFYVKTVNVDKENNTAKIKAILIPKKLWDPYALEQESQTLK